MERVELLTVGDSFEISGRGVVIIPDFSVPKSWTNRTETTVLITPDGQELETEAQFEMTHFNIPDPSVPIEKRWRVVVLLPNRSKKDVPVGSKILVSKKLRDAVLGTTIPL